MTRTKTQGFTLIEAAVAIAVVAILSGIIVPLVVKNLNDARVARARNDIQVIAGAIASQLKDTGRRPFAANGPNGATAAAGQVWASGPATLVSFPTNATGSVAANTFTNLFTYAGTVAQTQALFFGAGAGVTVGSEFAYKGPYLAQDVTAKLDPWGFRYLILGYNNAGQTGSLPIYVLCAGPDGSIATANWNGGLGPIATTGWNANVALSQDDIVVRVN